MNATFGPFLVILAALLTGYLFRRSGRFVPDASKTLNTYVIAIALPAVILSQLPRFLRNLASSGTAFDSAVIFLPIVPWIIFLVAIPFFGALYRLGMIRRDQWGMLVLTAGLGNTSFVGLPLLDALLGPESLPPALLLDQLGTFLALSVGGPLWISYFREGPRPEARQVLRDVMRFPPFLAILIAFFAAALGEWPAVVQDALERVATTLVPVALVSVGVQLQFRGSLLRSEGKGLAVGLGYKMVLAPVFIWAFASLLGMSEPTREIAVLEAAMAPMITATVLAMEAGLAPNLGALMLGIGIPLSLVTVPLIHLAFPL